MCCCCCSAPGRSRPVGTTSPAPSCGAPSAPPSPSWLLVSSYGTTVAAAAAAAAVVWGGGGWLFSRRGAADPVVIFLPTTQLPSCQGIVHTYNTVPRRFQRLSLSLCSREDGHSFIHPLPPRRDRSRDGARRALSMFRRCDHLTRSAVLFARPGHAFPSLPCYSARKLLCVEPACPIKLIQLIQLAFCEERSYSRSRLEWIEMSQSVTIARAPCSGDGKPSTQSNEEVLAISFSQTRQTDKYLEGLKPLHMPSTLPSREPKSNISFGPSVPVYTASISIDYLPDIQAQPSQLYIAIA